LGGKEQAATMFETCYILSISLVLAAVRTSSAQVQVQTSQPPLHYQTLQSQKAQNKEANRLSRLHDKQRAQEEATEPEKAPSSPGSVIAVVVKPPFYAVEKWCDRVARSSGERSEFIYAGCVSQEQSAYDKISQTWNTLPSQTQAWCDRVARSGGVGSYMILDGCVEQEVSAGQQNSKTQFRR
jgi:hypothetical protein